jgi:glycosyltransferase involved in cell wall biosynthesis
VIPSLEENLALTFIDSQLCGTPAITFDIGGFQEHIENGKNGLKAGEPNAEELRSSLIHFLSNRDQFNKKQIATDALRKFGQSSLAPKYINLYQSLLQ